VFLFLVDAGIPPDIVPALRSRKRPGDNETGFKGTGDTHYRMEAWEFLLTGGGLYNNLDYSFAVGHEDGTFKYPAAAAPASAPRCTFSKSSSKASTSSA
jgi:hypothetical protein